MADRPLPNKLSLRPSEAAAALGVSSRTIDRWLSDGKLPFTRLPSGHKRIRAADLVRYLPEDPAP